MVQWVVWAQVEILDPGQEFVIEPAWGWCVKDPSSMVTGPRSVFSSFYQVIYNRCPLRLFYGSVSVASSVFLLLAATRSRGRLANRETYTRLSWGTWASPLFRSTSSPLCAFSRGRGVIAGILAWVSTAMFPILCGGSVLTTAFGTFTGRLRFFTWRGNRAELWNFLSHGTVNHVADWLFVGNKFRFHLLGSFGLFRGFFNVLRYPFGGSCRGTLEVEVVSK